MLSYLCLFSFAAYIIMKQKIKINQNESKITSQSRKRKRDSYSSN